MITMKLLHQVNKPPAHQVLHHLTSGQFHKQMLCQVLNRMSHKLPSHRADPMDLHPHTIKAVTHMLKQVISEVTLSVNTNHLCLLLAMFNLNLLSHNKHPMYKHRLIKQAVTLVNSNLMDAVEAIGSPIKDLCVLLYVYSLVIAEFNDYFNV